ncbi:MAG: carbohydrate kinase family protein [Promethearchaeota archaeon]
MVITFDVICIGAALVDMIAQVVRHPSDDDEVFVSDLTVLSGGAAANTAYACAKIGLSTAFIGKLGDKDTFGEKIINDFKEVAVDTRLIKYSKEYRTGSAYVALNQKGERRIYAYSGAANFLSKEDISEKELKNAKIIFLSSLKNIEPLIAAAEIGKSVNTPVILNPGMLIVDQGFANIKKLLEKIDVLILSQREYRTLLNVIENELNEALMIKYSEKLLSLGIQVIVVTLGEKGSFFLFSAGFIYGLAQSIIFDVDHLRIYLKTGNYLAGNCIQQIGARNGIPSEERLNFFWNSNK